MRFIFLIVIALLITNCSKPKTVLICGDHICVNKTEANQYFEENLSLEVRIINKKVKKEIDLVELNLKERSNKQREVTIKSKENTNKKIKTLSTEEIIQIKKNIKIKEKKEKIAKKILKKNINENKVQKPIVKKLNDFKKKKNTINVNKTNKKIVDVCTILEKCSIDEISKYLLKEGKKKKFPDITSRQ